MGKNPRNGVNIGDPLAIAASQVNFVNRLMNADTSFRAGPMDGWQFGNSVIMCRNGTGFDVPRWGVLAIGGVEINPSAEDRARRSFEAMPCIFGTTPTTTTGGKFVIAVEPIRAGDIGRVCAAGVVQARVSVTSTSHAAARPKAGSRTELESSKTGPAQILWSSSGGYGSNWALIRFGADIKTVREPDDCGRTIVDAITLTTTSCYGGGLKASAKTSGDCKGPIVSVEIEDGGSNYATRERVMPSLSIAGGGAGASFVATMQEMQGDGCGRPTWAVQSVSVTGGTGYSNGSYLTVTVPTGTVVETAAKLKLSTVPDSGGVPLSVAVDSAGEYYALGSGVYVDEDITLNVDQLPPSDGTGATFQVNVDDDPDSPTFGTIVSIDVVDGGDGYFDRTYNYETTFGGIDFTEVPGYDGTKTQMLGHEPNGCMRWYTAEECDPVETGVCCIDGEVNGDYTTQESCEAANGTWAANVASDTMPGPCCE